jgi:hypothetical protein
VRYDAAAAVAAGMTRQNWSYIAYALTAVAVLVFLLTMVMLSRVKVAIACIKVRWLFPSHRSGAACAMHAVFSH